MLVAGGSLVAVYAALAADGAVVVFSLELELDA